MNKFEVTITDLGISSSIERDKNGNETLQSFLARGGKITHVPAQEPTIKAECIKSSSAGGPAVFLSLGEADLFYGEHKPKKAKKSKASFNVNDLPEALRKKFVDEVMNGKEEADDDSEED